MPKSQHHVVALLREQTGRQGTSIGKGVSLSMVTEDKSYSQLGWRFVTGVTLIIGGYAAWSLIPLTVSMHMHPGAKSIIAALLGATPFVTKLIAVGLMGRPAYELFKRDVWNALRRSAGPAA